MEVVGARIWEYLPAAGESLRSVAIAMSIHACDHLI